MTLDAGGGFSLKDNTGTIERLRVDEATGNISRNGALFVHTTGTNNTFVGAGAGNTATTGLLGRNSALGASALGANTTGKNNSAFGDRALSANTTGIGNSAFGTGALVYNTTGANNTAVGNSALRNTTTGQLNIGVGAEAGSYQTTGNFNIYLFDGGVAGETGRIRIGTGGVQAATFIAGIRGVTTGLAGALPVLVDAAGQLGTASSSRSVKKDIHDMGDATAHLLDLRPVTFRYKQQQTLPSGEVPPPEYGLIAEEVAEVFPDLVVYDEKGQPFTVKYHEMAPMLLNEMKKERATAQEDERTIENQAAVIQAQQRENQAQQAEIAALSTRLARVEARVIGASDNSRARR